MFKNIVSNLPFSPALVGQLGFYVKRLRDEEATRRLGLIFVALALVMQSLAVFQAPQSANASSGGDLVSGGIPGTTVSGLLGIYDNNTQNFRDVMSYVGITRANLASTQLQTFKTGKKIIWGASMHYSYSDGERSYNIYNSSGTLIKTIYSRPLSLSGSATREFTGWVGQASFGWFAIRQSCGNLVADIIPPKPPEKCSLNSDWLASDSRCKPCLYNSSILAGNPLCVAPVVSIPCIYNTAIKATDSNCRPCPYNLLIWVNSASCVKPPDKCALNPNLLASDTLCQPCPGNETIWINDPSCTPNIVKSKTSINLTQGSVDGSSVIAKAGDQISYTIAADNTGTNKASSVELKDSLADVLEYATLVDSGGGIFDQTTKNLSWPSVDIAAKAKQTRTFVVKMLDTIPATARGASNDTSFDCIITNTFGNSISIKVDCPTPKVVEQIVTNLPVTGPKENFIFAGIVLSVVTYFYARSRQQGKEIRLIRKDISMGTI